MGRQDDVLQLPESRMNGRLPFEDIETGAGKGSLPERLNQRRIVHHSSPGGMDEDRRRFHEGDLRGADRVVGLPAVGYMNRNDVRPAEELILCHISGPAGRLDLGGGPPDIMVEHLHLETHRAAGHDLADPSQTDDAQRGMVHIKAEKLLELPLVPPSFADVGLGLVQPAGRGEDQRPGKIGGGIIQDAGGVGGHDPMRIAGGQVDIVVSDGDVAYRLQLGTAARADSRRSFRSAWSAPRPCRREPGPTLLR